MFICLLKSHFGVQSQYIHLYTDLYTDNLIFNLSHYFCFAIKNILMLFFHNKFQFVQDLVLTITRSVCFPHD